MKKMNSKDYKKLLIGLFFFLFVFSGSAQIIGFAEEQFLTRQQVLLLEFETINLSCRGEPVIDSGDSWSFFSSCLELRVRKNNSVDSLNWSFLVVRKKIFLMQYQKTDWRKCVLFSGLNRCQTEFNEIVLNVHASQKALIREKIGNVQNTLNNVETPPQIPTIS